MKISYYPGCTLKTRAKSMDDSTRSSLRALGIDLVEPKRWTCCGVVHCDADDDIIHLLGPVRNLVRIRNEGNTKVIVPCAMCYNALFRANLVMKQDDQKRATINKYLEEDYNGEVDVLHVLPFIRDEIGWDAVRKCVTAPLEGIVLAPYYGCALLRPPEAAIDNPSRPTVLSDLLRSIGATVVDFTASGQCCSSYQVVTHPDAATQASAHIVASAKESGASALVTSCPLCDYNLGKQQKQSLKERCWDGGSTGTIYFTDLMSIAFGLTNYGRDKLVIEFDRSFK